ncbi:MAG: hypothetical protein AAB131_05600, partial [Actinomycetota bacterium]
MQIVLRENGSQMEVQCLSCPTDGGQHTQGIEDASGRFGTALAGRAATSFSLSSDGVLLTTGLGAGDAAGDVCDSCPDLWAASQVDSDHDQLGDACDNCDLVINVDQHDGDG